MPNNEHNAIDDLFSRQFENFSPPPPSGLWGNIEDDLNEAELDEAFRKKLAGAEVQPSAEVWNKISSSLPLNLLLSRFLTYTSTIAGVLVLGMAIQYGIFSYNNSQVDSAAANNIPQVPNYTSTYTPNSKTATDVNSLKAGWQKEMQPSYEAYNRQAQATQAEVDAEIAAIRKRYSPEVANYLVNQVISYLEHSDDKHQASTYDYASRLNRLNIPKLLNAVSPRFAMQDALPSYMWFIPELPEQGSQDIVPSNPSSETQHKITRWALYGGAQVGVSSIAGDKLKQAYAQSGESINAKVSMGGQLEIGFNYAINKTLSLQSGVNYSQYNQIFEQSSDNTRSMLNTNYLSIPLSLVYTPVHSNWSYSAGVSYGQLFHTNANNATKDQLVKQSLGFNAGIDYTQALSTNTALQIGARANFNKDLARLGATNLLFGLRLGLVYSLGNAIP